MRERPLQVNEPAVAAAIEFRSRPVVVEKEWFAVDFGEPVTTERGYRESSVDYDLLRLPLVVAQSPDVVGGDGSGSQRGGSGVTKFEPALDDGIAALKAYGRHLQQISSSEFHQIRKAGA